MRNFYITLCTQTNKFWHAMFFFSLPIIDMDSHIICMSQMFQSKCINLLLKSICIEIVNIHTIKYMFFFELLNHSTHNIYNSQNTHSQKPLVNQLIK